MRLTNRPHHRLTETTPKTTTTKCTTRQFDFSGAAVDLVTSVPIQHDASPSAFARHGLEHDAAPEAQGGAAPRGRARGAVRFDLVGWFRRVCAHVTSIASSHHKSRPRTDRRAAAEQHADDEEEDSPRAPAWDKLLVQVTSITSQADGDCSGVLGTSRWVCLVYSTR